MQIEKNLLNYIGGNLIPPLANQFIDNIDPSTGKTYCYIPNSQAEDVELAFQAAKNKLQKQKKP